MDDKKKILEAIERIKEKCFEKLGAKNSWGKNEAGALIEASVNEVIVSLWLQS